MGTSEPFYQSLWTKVAEQTKRIARAVSTQYVYVLGSEEVVSLLLGSVLCKLKTILSTTDIRKIFLFQIIEENSLKKRYCFLTPGRIQPNLRFCVSI